MWKYRPYTRMSIKMFITCGFGYVNDPLCNQTTKMLIFGNPKDKIDTFDKSAIYEIAGNDVFSNILGRQVELLKPDLNST